MKLASHAFPILLFASTLVACAAHERPRHSSRDAGGLDAASDGARLAASDASSAAILDAADGLRLPRSDAGASLLPPNAGVAPAPCPATRFAPAAFSDAGTLDDAGASPSAPSLTRHPFLGAVTDRSMRIWFQSSAAADSCIEYWPLAHPEQSSTALGPQLGPDRDFTGTVTLAGLSAAESYGYRVWLAEPGQTFVAQDARAGTFKTAPPVDVPGRFRLIFGADISGSATPIFDEMRAQSPDLVLLLGDLAYMDGLAPTLAAFRDKDRANWAIPALARLASAVPTLGMWDDHDIIDNFWPGKDNLLPIAHEAFSEYVASRDPDPIRAGEFYFDFAIGDVGIFVLDERSHRSPNTDPDGPNKTMLGAQQRADLLGWLAGSPAAVKIIASPVLVSDFGNTGDDAWRGFKHEREEILSFIAERGIPNVLILSGDQHWSGLFKLVRGAPAYTFYEFEPTPLSKSAAKAPGMIGGDIVAEFGGDFVYGVVDVDTVSKPPRVDLTLCRTKVACRPGSEPAPVDGVAPFTVHLRGAAARGWNAAP
ncbi:MAG TPA: alkaline phosphatase D family protein [Polyangiales bacterium]